MRLAAMSGCRFMMPYKRRKTMEMRMVLTQEVPVGEHPQIGERFAGPKFPHDKRDKRDDGNHRERANKIGVEPVFILSLVQDGLQRAQPNRQDEEAKGVNAARVWRCGCIPGRRRIVGSSTWRPDRKGC